MTSLIEIVYSTIVVLLMTWGATAYNCSSAPAKPYNETTFYEPEDYVGSYAIDEVALFTCLTPGFGYVYVKCLGNDTWSSPDRNCTDGIPIGNGSIVGMTCMLLTLLVTVSAVAISYTVTSPDKDEDTTELTCDLDHKGGAYAVNHVSDIDEGRGDDITPCPDTAETRLGETDELTPIEYVSTQNGTVKEPADDAAAIEHLRLQSVGSSTVELSPVRSANGSSLLNNNSLTDHLVIGSDTAEC